jgi:hypothetical protein
VAASERLDSARRRLDLCAVKAVLESAYVSADEPKAGLLPSVREDEDEGTWDVNSDEFTRSAAGQAVDHLLKELDDIIAEFEKTR